MTAEERDNAIRCLKKWSEEAPYLQTYKTCLEALEATDTNVGKINNKSPHNLTEQGINEKVVNIGKAIKYTDEVLAEWLKECRNRTVSLNAVIEDIKQLSEWNDGQFTADRVINHLRQMPSVSQDGDLISRQSAIKAAVDAADDWDGGWNPTREGYITEALKALPSVAPEPQTGHWRKENYGHVEYSAECSECGEYVPWSDRTPYCGWCGARMREDGEL